MEKSLLNAELDALKSTLADEQRVIIQKESVVVSLEQRMAQLQARLGLGPWSG